MGVRTVRLDDESERLLADLQKASGLSITEVFKQGLLALRHAGPERGRRPYDVYAALDLGPGGYAAAPASRSKAAVRELIRRKHRR